MVSEFDSFKCRFTSNGNGNVRVSDKGKGRGDGEDNTHTPNTLSARNESVEKSTFYSSPRGRLLFALIDSKKLSKRKMGSKMG